MEPKDFVHPLSILETVDTEAGKKEVINSWAFASMIWSSALAGHENALMIVDELSINKDEMTKFLRASKAGNSAAARSAIAIIAFAIDEKIQEAFVKKQTRDLIEDE